MLRHLLSTQASFRQAHTSTYLEAVILAQHAAVQWFDFDVGRTEVDVTELTGRSQQTLVTL